MSARYLAVIAVMLLSLVGVLGDILLKKASEQSNWFANPYFVLGVCVYSSTAFGWIFAVQYLKMATVGVIYAVTMIVFLALSGALLFNERLSVSELFGIALALGSLILLSRHA